MKSRNRRALRSLATTNLLFLLIRAVVLGFFIYLLVIAGKAYVPALSDKPPMSIGADGELNLRLPLSEVIQGKLVFIAILAALAFVSFAKGLRAIFAEHQSRADVPIHPVQSYLDAHRFRKMPFVLMLRPFDSDGFLILEHQRSFWQTALFPSVHTSTVEQIFQREAAAFPDVQVVSIADPYKDELVPGPTYLMTGPDWQADVDALMEAAAAIVFVIPPGAQLSSGLSWEIDQIFARSRTPKSIAVFPPRRRKDQHTSTIMNQFMPTSRGFLEQGVAPDQIFQLELRCDGSCWFEMDQKRGLRAVRAFASIYQNAAREWLNTRFATK